MKFKPTKPSLLALFIWLASFCLAFKIAPTSRYIWLPDTVLLLGFFPLLIGGRAQWLWLGFGVGNMIVGYVLAMSGVIPDAQFTQPHMLEIKRHLGQYHPFIVWLLIGALSTLIGLIILVIKLIHRLLKKSKY